MNETFFLVMFCYKTLFKLALHRTCVTANINSETLEFVFNWILQAYIFSYPSKEKILKLCLVIKEYYKITINNIKENLT